MYVAEEKNSGAELAPAEEFFIPLKFSAREPSGEQENLYPMESDSSLSMEASALPMRFYSLAASFTMRWASLLHFSLFSWYIRALAS